MTKTITVKLEPSCEMAGVWVEDECVMVGNYWDFYPGCHGIHKYGEFKGPFSLARAIERALKNRGEEVVIVRKEGKF